MTPAPQVPAIPDEWAEAAAQAGYSEDADGNIEVDMGDALAAALPEIHKQRDQEIREKLDEEIAFRQRNANAFRKAGAKEAADAEQQAVAVVENTVAAILDTVLSPSPVEPEPWICGCDGEKWTESGRENNRTCDACGEAIRPPGNKQPDHQQPKEPDGQGVSEQGETPEELRERLSRGESLAEREAARRCTCGHHRPDSTWGHAADCPLRSQPTPTDQEGPEQPEPGEGEQDPDVLTEFEGTIRFMRSGQPSDPLNPDYTCNCCEGRHIFCRYIEVEKPPGWPFADSQEPRPNDWLRQAMGRGPLENRKVRITMALLPEPNQGGGDDGE